MDGFHILSVNLVVVLTLMTILWVVSLPLKNASIVDVFWGFGFVIIAWSSIFLAGGWTSRAIVLTILVSIWGLRLTIHLGRRAVGKTEDYRYAMMRDRRANTFWLWSLPAVFLLQGAIMWVVALPLQLTPQTRTPLGWLDVAGLTIWFLGFLIESVGDHQLARFRANPDNRGRVMQSGLWRYTRHPNYFGDFLVWWGFFIMAAASGQLWWTVISPLIMSLLLIRVSGVALLEKTISKRRPEYSEYAARTSAFVPWFPQEN